MAFLSVGCLFCPPFRTRPALSEQQAVLLVASAIAFKNVVCPVMKSGCLSVGCLFCPPYALAPSGHASRRYHYRCPQSPLGPVRALCRPPSPRPPRPRAMPSQMEAHGLQNIFKHKGTISFEKTKFGFHIIFVISLQSFRRRLRWSDGSRLCPQEACVVYVLETKLSIHQTSTQAI